MPFGRHHPEWGTFFVTLCLLAIAAVNLYRGDSNGLSGAVVGFVAGYWLPTRPSLNLREAQMEAGAS